MLVDEDRADHIDLNFGCPVPKVTRKGGGAALPWKLDLFREIVERAVQAAGPLPLTVKMRKGIDADHLTYLEAGRIAEGAGVASIALHARTAAEFYSGTADWSAIAKLKEAVTERPGARQRRHLVAPTTPADDGGDRLRRRRRRPRLPRPPLAVRRPRRRVRRRRRPAAPARRSGAGRRAGVPAGTPSCSSSSSATTRMDGEHRGCRDIRKHVAWYFKGYARRRRARAPRSRRSSRCSSSTTCWAPLDARPAVPGRGRGGPARPRRHARSARAARRLARQPRARRRDGRAEIAGAELRHQRWLIRSTPPTSRYGERGPRAVAARGALLAGAATSPATAPGCCTRARCAASPPRPRCSSPTIGLDFARNRLTHSLEVAQVGPRARLAASASTPDVVDTACLAHDLGHPPFGHNGERALSDVGGGHRRLRGQRADAAAAHPPRAEGVRRGRARPTASTSRARASTRAASTRGASSDAVGDPSGRAKFGFYAGRRRGVRVAAQGAPGRAPVHRGAGHGPLRRHRLLGARLRGRRRRRRSSTSRRSRSNAAQRDVVAAMYAWVGGAFDQDELVEALHRLRAMEPLDRSSGTARAARMAR